MSTSDSVNWTVTSLDAPTGTVCFRVVAAAATYPDQISGAAGPFNIVAGLPDIGSFLLTTGGTPIRSSNPWQFLAAYTTLVPGLQLRVQSTETTNEDGSWEDLPENPYMTNDAGAWTLNCTDVPTGKPYFRVIAFALGYVDGVSTIVGPQTVLAGFDLWGFFSFATTIPYSTATAWSFAIVQPSVIPGISLRMQSSQAEQPDIWTDLPDGVQMTLFSGGPVWLLLATNLPTGLITFRVIASAPDYVDLASGPLGPFLIVPPLPIASTTLSHGGSYTVQDFQGFINGINAVIHVIAVAVHLVPDGNATTQGAITLSADQGGSVDLTLKPGQVLTASQLNVGTGAKLIGSGTVNGNLNVGLISQDGGGLIGQDGGGLLSQDGGGLLSQDGGGIIGLNSSGLAVIVAASLKQNTDAPVLSVNGSAVLSANGSAVLSANGSAVLTGKRAKIPPSANPLAPKPNAPMPTQPSFTGIITVNGDYSQLAGALIIAIAGTNTASDGAQQYDQLVVNGQANFFGGRIAFGLFDPDDQTDLTNVFQPPNGATFDVVVASNIVTRGLTVRGPVWGDGQFVTWSVVTRPDGLQALRLVAIEVPPRLFLQNAGAQLQLGFATNYTGYNLQSSTDLSSPNWTTISPGTNMVMVSPTNAIEFFRLSQP